MSDDEGSDGATAEVQGHEELVDRVAEHDEDVAEEVAELVDRLEDAEETIEERDERLAELEERADDLESRLKRKQADFENYKKRQKREQNRIRQRATEALVERLLDVRDNLRRAVEDDHDDVESIHEGVKMTLTEFDRVLDAEGVTEIDPEPGTAVDPQRHEVLMRVEGDLPEGTIAEVYAPGYEMADKVVRAAQVTVSDGSEADPDGGDEREDEEDLASTDEGTEDDGEGEEAVDEVTDEGDDVEATDEVGHPDADDAGPTDGTASDDETAADLDESETQDG